MSTSKAGWGTWWTALTLLGGLIVVLVFTGLEFTAMWSDPPIYPGPGVTEIRKLSDYAPVIANTAADTEVYILQGAEPGGTVLILGGNHPNEPAAKLTAVVIVERAEVTSGRVIVVPRANRSGHTCTDPHEGYPQFFEIDTPDGPRTFRYGSRATNPIHQWPDPVIHINAAGQTLAGQEVRNLNRAFPGREAGYLTEQLAHAYVELIRTERVDLAVDLHEASPEYPVINAIVAHDRAMDLAVEASMFLELEGVRIGVERSPAGLRGLSHREWGDATDTLAVLLETANPAQGRLRGRTDTDLIITGQDRFYVSAARRGLLYVPFTDAGHPIEERVGRHLTTLDMLLAVHGMHSAESAVRWEGVPMLTDLRANGLGAYLTPPDQER